MKLRTWTVVAAMAGLLLGSLAPVASGQDDERLHYAGIVLAVDTANRLVTVEEASLEGPQVRFIVMDGAEITKDGKEADLASIEIGDPVSIEYRKTAAGNEAEAVDVITSPST